MRKFVSINNFKGLHTVEGVLGAPEGSFEIADNVDFPDTTKVSMRRGLEASSFPAMAGTPIQLAYGLQESGGGITPKIVASAAVNTASAHPTMLVSADTGAAIPIVSSVPVFGTDLPMHSARFGQNLYLTSNNGVIRVEFASGTPIARWAGIAQAHAPYSPVTQTAGAGAWLQSGYATSYRFVYAYHMKDGSILRSAPSHKIDVANTSGASTWVTIAGRYVDAANSPFTDPFDPTNAEVIDLEIYRSPQAPGLVGTDEMQLCYKRPLTSAEKTAAAVFYADDKCPDAALGAYLYTNANTGDTIIGGVSAGLAGRNDEPPRCTDLATYANRLFFSNCRQKHTLTLSLISVGTAGALLKTGDVISVDGFSLTAGTHFLVYTAGTVAQNISQTAISLAYGINDYVAGVKAEYVGNPLSAQSVGLIRLTARSHSAAGFSVMISSGGSGASFVPNLDSPAYSSQEDRTNWLAWSKDGQPDAVPPVNYTQVGRGVIERIIPSRDALYIMATDGLWRLTGSTDDNFAVEMVDSTFRLADTEYVAAIGELIYAWTTHGISVITTGGVVPIDGPIKNVVRTAYIEGVAGGFAVAERSTDRVMFFLPSRYGDANAATQTSFRALVFNANSKLWSRYVYPVRMGVTHAIEIPESWYSKLVFSMADNGGGTSEYNYSTDEWPHSFQHQWWPPYDYIYTAGPATIASIMVESPIAGGPDARGDRAPGGGIPKVVLKWTSYSEDPFAMAQWHDVALFFSDDQKYNGMVGYGFIDILLEAEDQGASAWMQYLEIVALSAPRRFVIPSEVARAQRMTVTVRTQWDHVAADQRGWTGFFSMSGIGLTYDVDGIEVSR